MHLTFRNVNDAFRGLVDCFATKPRADKVAYYLGETPIVSRSSRNGSVLVIDEPVTITYARPTERVLFNPVRDANPFFHLYEALWMLTGRNSVTPLTYYAGRMKEFSDDGETLNGAYGYRWRHAKFSESDGRAIGVGMIDQLDLLAAHLKANPTSRRAVLQMWNVEDDLLKVDVAADVCCNLSVVFSVQDSVLDMTVVSRSEDLMWGLLGADYVDFTILQEYVAARLGTEVGKYHHFTNNLHVYADRKDWRPAELLAWSKEGSAVGGPVYLPFRNGEQVCKFVPLVRDPEVFEAELPAFVEQFSGKDVATVGTWFEPFLETVAAPMMMAYQAYKLKGATSLSWAQRIEADDWRIACTNWLERRVKKYEDRLGS